MIMEPDLSKDSSAEVSILLRALDWVKAELDRKGCPLPEHLVIEVGHQHFEIKCFESCPCRPTTAHEKGRIPLWPKQVPWQSSLTGALTPLFPDSSCRGSAQ